MIMKNILNNISKMKKNWNKKNRNFRKKKFRQKENLKKKFCSTKRNSKENVK